MKDNKELKTNYLPALIMLLAGFIYCLFGIKNGVPALDFTVQLLIVLLVFYILGGIIRLLFEHLMKMTETSVNVRDAEELYEQMEDEEEGEQENIQTEEE